MTSLQSERATTSYVPTDAFPPRLYSSRKNVKVGDWKTRTEQWQKREAQRALEAVLEEEFGNEERRLRMERERELRDFKRRREQRRAEVLRDQQRIVGGASIEESIVSGVDKTYSSSRPAPAGDRGPPDDNSEFKEGSHNAVVPEERTRTSPRRELSSTPMVEWQRQRDEAAPAIVLGKPAGREHDGVSGVAHGAVAGWAAPEILIAVGDESDEDYNPHHRGGRSNLPGDRPPVDTDRPLDESENLGTLNYTHPGPHPYTSAAHLAEIRQNRRERFLRDHKPKQEVWRARLFRLLVCVGILVLWGLPGSFIASHLVLVEKAQSDPGYFDGCALSGAWRVGGGFRGFSGSVLLLLSGTFSLVCGTLSSMGEEEKQLVL